jgi:hypothetical protein
MWIRDGTNIVSSIKNQVLSMTMKNKKQTIIVSSLIIASVVMLNLLAFSIRNPINYRSKAITLDSPNPNCRYTLDILDDPKLTPTKISSITPTNIPSKKALKHILVSVTGQSGFGTNTDLNILAKKVRLLKSIGVDALRVDIPWKDVEKTDGNWDFSQWRDRFKTIVDNELMLKPIISVHFDGYIPDWFWQRYPDAKFVNGRGTESRQYISYWHPQMRSAIEQVTKAYFEQLFSEFEDKILAIHISAGMYGEPWYPHVPELGFYAFDSNAIKDFRQKMQEKYSRSIVQANNAWQTNFPSWSEVVPPKVGEYIGKRKFWEDFLVWYRTNKEEYLSWIVSMTRKYTSKPLVVYGGAGVITDQIWNDAIDSLSNGSFSQNSFAWAIQRMVDNRALYPVLAQNNVWIEPPNLPHRDQLNNHFATAQKFGLSFNVWGENEGSMNKDGVDGSDPIKTAELVREYSLDGMEFLSTDENPLFDEKGDPVQPLFNKLKDSIILLKGSIPISPTPTPNTWNITAQPVCPAGKIPKLLRMFRVFWGAGDFNCVNTTPATGNQTMSITSRAPYDGVYAGLEVPDRGGVSANCSEGTAFQPTAINPSSTAVNFGHYMNPYNWMARWTVKDLASGNYTIQFQVPEEYCITPTPTIIPKVIRIFPKSLPTLVLD